MGGFKLNLDGVEPWKPSGVILGPGEHIVKVVDEEVDTSGDHPVVQLQMEAVSGDEAGGEIRDWVHITEKSKGRVAQVLAGCGVEIPEGDFSWPGLKDRYSKIIVRREPKRSDPTKEVSVVKGYVAVDPAEATKGHEQAPPPTDEDIPF